MTIERRKSDRRIPPAVAQHAIEERAELLARIEEQAREIERLECIVDKAWNRSHSIEHGVCIPGALDAWKRPVLQFLPYDFSGNPGASATQYCNGWNDAGGYWKAHADDLSSELAALKEQRRGGVVLPERANVLYGTGRDTQLAEAYNDALDEVARLNAGRAVAVPDCWQTERFDYQAIFNAIAAATSVKAGKGSISISVMAFEDAMIAATSAKKDAGDE